jgi:dienelactone hydrolase
VLLVVGLVVVGAGGFFVYARPLPLLPEATAALASTPEVAFTTIGRDLVFRPTGSTPTIGLVLYPGAKVPSAAYAPIAQRIAASGGVVVTIVDVPFNLAVLDLDAASRVIRRESRIGTWAVGGHSLGGSVAARYVAAHPESVQGLVLWASDSPADLSALDLAVLSIYGSRDAAMPAIRSEANLAKLPETTTYVEISGGNDEQMGWYTGQPDDPPATLSRIEQQNQLVIATSRFLTALGVAPGS